MIHRLALLMGGAGAAGVLALALTLNGSAPAANPDAFVPVANDVAGADQLALAAPTDTSVQVADPGTDQPAPITEKQVDTIYVVPPPKPVIAHTDKPAGGKDNQPSDTPQPGGNGGGGNGGGGNGGGGNGGGNVAGDDNQGDDQGDEADDSSDDQAGGEDEHDGDDHSDDGGSDDGGHEPGDD